MSQSRPPETTEPDRPGTPAEATDVATDDTLAAPDSQVQVAAGAPPVYAAPPLGSPDATQPAAPTEAQLRVTLPDVTAQPGDLDRLPVVNREFYDFGGELARGGMGRILYARDRRVGRPVAIKELVTKSPGGIARFLREATLTARLQHPGIVPIYEAGRWPDGSPFFAMKLVEGRSLDKAIKSAATPRERLSLLANVIAVADALAYAHSRRVIHRDLKPANILVGDYGETVVIDWGLGKDLRAEQDADLAISMDDNVDAALTMAGAAMGTPSFMPPEQAKGGEVNERSDVYALGALLYQVLSGTAPYSNSGARSADEMLDLVRSGPPRPLAELAPDAPADLVDVVDKAMARDPADRYPNAEALATDLERYQAGQLVGAHQYSPWELLTRWIGRHRAAVTIAAIAALSLAVLGGIGVQRIRHERTQAEAQRRIAVDQRARAETSRAEVEDLLDFMLGELRVKLEPIGRLDILTLVARKATDYYRTPSENETPAQAARRARSLDQLARVLRQQGDRETATANHRAALALRRQMFAADPDNPAVQHDLSMSLCAIGDLETQQGDTDQALADLEECERLRLAIVEEHPDDGEERRLLAASQERLGDLAQQRGDVARALSHFADAEQNLQQLLTSPRQRPAVLRALAAIDNQIGTLALDRGDAATALARFRASYDILARLHQELPDDVILFRQLAIAQGAVGDISLALGKTSAATDAYRAALVSFQQITELDPSNTNWQRELAASQTKVAAALLQQGDRTGALRMHRKALEGRRRLVDRDPDNGLWQTDLANSYVLLASTLASGRPSRESRELGRQGAELYARSAKYAQDFYNAACGYSLAGERDRAFEMLDRCVDLGFADTAALSGDPDLAPLRADPRWKALLARIARPTAP